MGKRVFYWSNFKW